MSWIITCPRCCYTADISEFNESMSDDMYCPKCTEMFFFEPEEEEEE